MSRLGGGGVSFGVGSALFQYSCYIKVGSSSSTLVLEEVTQKFPPAAVMEPSIQVRPAYTLLKSEELAVLVQGVSMNTHRDWSRLSLYYNYYCSWSLGSRWLHIFSCYLSRPLCVPCWLQPRFSGRLHQHGRSHPIEACSPVPLPLVHQRETMTAL